MEAKVEARRLVITGLVQGVGFRFHMVNAALRLNITGWVRNRHNSSVEAVIMGSPESIAGMIDWARQGPPAAHVEQVFVEEIETVLTLQGFSQRVTE
jgi:acylphosphatase